MAYVDIIGKVFSTRADEALRRGSIYNTVVQDRSAEVISQGNELVVPNIGTAVSIGDYVPGTAIVYANLVPAGVSLLLNKKKYGAFQIDDVNEIGSAVNVMNMGVMEASEQMAIQVDKDILAQMIADTPAGRRTAWLSVASHATNEVVDTEDNRETLVKALINFVSEQRAKGWSRLGGVFLSMPPKIEQMLMEYFVIDKPALTGATQAGVTENGILGSIFGSRVLVDNEIAGAQTATATRQYSIHAGIVGKSVKYAQQINRAEPLRDQSQFGDLFRLLYVYGEKVDQTDQIAELSVTMT